MQGNLNDQPARNKLNPTQLRLQEVWQEKFLKEGKLHSRLMDQGRAQMFKRVFFNFYAKGKRSTIFKELCYKKRLLKL
jgi:hypothetical protein